MNILFGFPGRKFFSPSSPKRSLLPLSPRRTQVRLRPLLFQVSGHRQICFRPRGGLSSARVPSAGGEKGGGGGRREGERGERGQRSISLNSCLPRLINSRGTCHFNPQPVSSPRGSCAFQAFFRGAQLTLGFRLEKYATAFFLFESGELQNNTPEDSSSHCSSVQERLVTYGSEALDTIEHLGLIVGSQKRLPGPFQHFGSLAVLGRASVEQLLPFVSRSKALRLVSSLSHGCRGTKGGTSIAHPR